MKLEDIKSLTGLLESPQSIGPVEFNLDKKDVNIKEASKLLLDKSKVALKSYENGDYTLYQFSRAYALIDHRDKFIPRIAYLVKFKVSQLGYVKRQSAQQILVWRNFADAVTQNLAKDIFFNYLLADYEIMVTDIQQTGDGQRFWANRVFDAFNLKKFVYFLSEIQPRELIRINTEKEFKELYDSDKVWGSKQKHWTKRIIIAEKELTLYI